MVQNNWQGYGEESGPLNREQMAQQKQQTNKVYALVLMNAVFDLLY